MNTKKLFKVSKKNEVYEDNNIKYSERSERNISEPISNPPFPQLEENEVPQEESVSFASLKENETNEDNDINWSNNIDNLNIFFKEQKKFIEKMKQLEKNMKQIQKEIKQLHEEMRQIYLLKGNKKDN